MMFFKDNIKKDHKIYSQLVSERFSLEENSSEKKILDEKIKQIDDFVENVYAKDVFEKYCKKQPELVRNKDNQVVTWKEAFGDDFNKVSKSLRHSLVGLVENGGRYRFK